MKRKREEDKLDDIEQYSIKRRKIEKQINKLQKDLKQIKLIERKMDLYKYRLKNLKEGKRDMLISNIKIDDLQNTPFKLYENYEAYFENDENYRLNEKTFISWKENVELGVTVNDKKICKLIKTKSNFKPERYEEPFKDFNDELFCTCQYLEDLEYYFIFYLPNMEELILKQVKDKKYDKILYYDNILIEGKIPFDVYLITK